MEDENATAVRGKPLPVAPSLPDLHVLRVMCGRPPPARPPLEMDAINVAVNCFRVGVPRRPGTEYFSYEIAASRVRDYTPHDSKQFNEWPKWLRHEIAHQVTKHHVDAAPVVYDGGSVLYSPVRLFGGEPAREISSLHVDRQSRIRRGGEFAVTVEFVSAVGVALVDEYMSAGHGVVDVRPAMQAIDLALRSHNSLSPVVYDMRNPTAIRGDTTREIVHGTHQSVRMTTLGPVLVLDVVQSVFYVPDISLLDFARAVAGVTYSDELPGCRRKWEASLCGIDVYTNHTHAHQTHPNGTQTHVVVQKIPRTVCEVGARDARQTTFEKRGSTVSVMKHFQDQYPRSPIKRPYLPLVNLGSRGDPEWLPMELCFVCPGRRCSDNATVAKIKKLTPTERHTRIQDGFRRLGLGSEAFGLSVNSRMVEDGRSTFDRGHQLFRGAKLKSWCIVNFSRLSSEDVDMFAHELQRKAAHLGVEVDHYYKPRIVSRSATGTVVEDVMTQAVNFLRGRGDPVDLVLVVLESSTSQHYAEVKRVAESVLGVPNQMVVGDRKKLQQPAYIANIILQINIKLGGANWVLAKPCDAMETGHTITFGVSVDRPRESTAHVIIAVVTFLDGVGSKFVTRQKAVRHQEVPNKIIYFRDAVSDGELKTMFDSETTAIAHARCKFSVSTRPPPMNLILVTCSQHLRAFPVRSHGVSRRPDRSGNVPAGTVIDTEIVDPRRFDFFLYGHSGLVGTSRPALYNVLLNELGLGAQQAYQLCYDWCHLVGRSVRSVAVPAPVVYAQDLVVESLVLLGRRAPNSALIEDVDGSDEQDERAVPVHANLCELPFYS